MKDGWAQGISVKESPTASNSLNWPVIFAVWYMKAFSLLLPVVFAAHVIPARLIKTS